MRPGRDGIRSPWRAAAGLLLLLWLAQGCAGNRASGTAAPPPPVEGDGPWNLTLFHVNDIHAQFVPQTAWWRDDKAPVGGVVPLAAWLAEERRTAPASLLLDAGDFMTGNPICEMKVDGAYGGALIRMFNRLGFDADVIGNHDLDKGRANARALAALARYPVLALDLVNEEGEREFPAAPPVLHRGGLDIGIIGVTCADLFDVTADNRTGGLRLLDQERVVRRWARELDPRTDLLVLITHDGVDRDTVLARRLAGSGIDIIVGGHSHTRLERPLLIGNILVVQAGAKLQNLGRLDLQVADDRVVAYRGRLIPVLADSAHAHADPELERMVAFWRARVDSAYGRPVAELAVAWKRNSRGESNVGDWLCDRLREAAGADVALLNSGTIRRGHAPGPLTRLDIYQMLPFDNTLVTFRVTGAQLRHILLTNTRNAESRRHGILQVGGLRYAYTVRDGEPVLLEVTVGGQPLDPDRVYTVACPDYVVMQADVYLDIPRPATTYAGCTVLEAVEAAAAAAGTITGDVDGRIQRR